MKQKDFAMILVIVIVSAIISFVLGRLIFASPKDRITKVELVDAISTTFPYPDGKYFNQKSINPTMLIQISENANNAPFKGRLIGGDI